VFKTPEQRQGPRNVLKPQFQEIKTGFELLYFILHCQKIPNNILGTKYFANNDNSLHTSGKLATGALQYRNTEYDNLDIKKKFLEEIIAYFP
jgi:hypothetical protein